MNLDNTNFSPLVRRLSLFAVAILLSGVAVLTAQARPALQDNGLVQVESKYVCMINNQRFDKEQIPVAVQGKTYYGCCEMCKGKLQGDAKSRMAIDPVSHKKVDKAKAIIGATADGKVFYFESLANLKKYKPAA
ncbi:MAG: hypothetical protein HY231_05620 [Acidobacteria bacterium]|nr:hypothetical protein [Acidobacteriota bacterium]